MRSNGVWKRNWTSKGNIEPRFVRTCDCLANLLVANAASELSYLRCVATPFNHVKSGVLRLSGEINPESAHIFDAQLTIRRASKFRVTAEKYWG
jgi:hypothetical protein